MRNRRVTTVDLTEYLRNARSKGAEDGAMAGAWHFGGGATREEYSQALHGLDARDPITLASLPTPSSEALSAYGDRSIGLVDRLCQAYELAFTEAAEAAVRAEAEYFVFRMGADED